MTNQKIPRVLVVGDVGIDIQITVPYLPAAATKLTALSRQLSSGGMAANVANTLARLGAPCFVLGAVGDDADGNLLIQELHKNSILTNYIEHCPNGLTSKCLILIDPQGQRIIIRLPSTTFSVTSSWLMQCVFQDIEHVHSTFGNPDITLQVLERTRHCQPTYSIDVERADLETQPINHYKFKKALETVNFLFLNRETRDYLESHGTLISPSDKLSIITTLDKDGTKWESSNDIGFCPSFDVTVKDTTGAGDAFVGGFLFAYLANYNLQDSIIIGNAVAAISITQVGAQAALPTFQEVISFLKRHNITA